MKIDLVGPQRRGFAMGLNEFAGYFAVAMSALATGYLANRYGLRPQPFYLGVAYTGIGLFLSVFLVRETRAHAAHEATLHGNAGVALSQREIFLKTSFKDRELSSVTQAGFVNNLNDGMAWGLFPLLFTSIGLSLKEIGWLPQSIQQFGELGRLGQDISHSLSGECWWAQNVLTATGSSFLSFAVGGVLLGVGTAMVYPTLLAAIGDVAHPSWRASSVGVYRLWRDSGYAAAVAGITADYFGIRPAIWLVALITFASGVVAFFRMRETL